MMKKQEINSRIIDKIESSELSNPIKNFIKEIIKFEIEEGKFSNRYTKKYQDLIDNTHINLRK